ncbi:MAG: AAA family ATPase [Planctomycetota bacterium]|jgi:DNA polymerase-3 subunit delta'
MPTLHDILGQSTAIELLNSAMRADRIHHAWIFHGPEGVGKSTTAHAFAAALLDDTTKLVDGCFVPDHDSRTQGLIDAGTHPNLHVVTKELARYSDDSTIRNRKLMSIPVEVVRQYYLEPAWKSAINPVPSMAQKVIIIEEAELLRDSQQTMLKTLEESPEGTVTILLTTNEDRLLPTVRSRCQRIAFTTLCDDDMQTWLARAGMTLPEDDDLVRDFAAGSPGRVMLAHETGMFEWGAQLAPLLRDADRGVFSPKLGEMLASLADDWAKQWVADHKNASKDSANKSATQRLLGMLSERARRSLRRAIERGDDPDQWLHAIDVISQTQYQIATNVNLKLAMANAGAQLSRSSGGVESPLLSLPR